MKTTESTLASSLLKQVVLSRVKSNNHTGRNKELTKMQSETNLSKGGGSLIQKDDSQQCLSEGRQSHHQRLEQHATESCYSQNSWVGGGPKLMEVITKAYHETNY